MGSSFDREYGQLNAAQKQAVDTIEGPVLVIAGPGTGKTQLLSMRVANILRRTDVQPSNILCLTFTESGQLAMQRRLLSLVGEDANQVSIHTFHGFGTAIIKANPECFFDGQAFGAADDLTLFEVLYDIFDRLPHANPLAKRGYGDFVYLKDAQERISQLKAAGITPEGLRAILAEDSAWCRQAEKLIAETYEAVPRMSLSLLPRFETLLVALEAIPLKTSDHPWLQSFGTSCLEALRGAIEAVQASQKTTALTAWKTTWLTRQNEAVCLKATEQHKKLEALAGIYESYLGALRTKRLFDYDDMILEVIATLEKTPDLLASLQEQYQYMLVDEFQDTNGAQAKLIEMLADNPVNEERPNLMVVGDDDQAIYGFQGADASVMLRFRERWRDVTTITLTDNYRSTQAILDTARELILHGQERLENYYDDINKALTANQPAGSQPSHLVFDDEVEQLNWLVHALQAQKQPLSTTAVLAPRHKYLQKLVPLLLAAQVPVHYERRSNVLEEPLVVQLITLARVVTALAEHNNPEANALLPELLSYEFWQIPPEWLWQISLEASQKRQSWLTLLENSKHPKLQDIAGWLQITARVAGQLPTGDMLDILRGINTEGSYTSPFQRYYNRQPQIEKDALNYAHLPTNLETLQRHLSTYLQDRPHTLPDLVRYALLCMQAGIRLSDIDPIDGDHDAVQVMTAHKAKGQEFGTVYIINATNEVWVKEKGMINKLSLPPNLTIQPPGESADDKLRVLYVAATRARNQLVFTSYRRNDQAKEASVLEWTMHVATVQPAPQQLTLVEEAYAAPQDWRERHFQAAAAHTAHKVLRGRLEQYRLSATHLNTFLDVTHGGPEQFLVRHLLRFPEVLSADAAFGHATHSAMEFALKQSQATKKPVAAKKVVEHFTKTLSASHLRPIDHERLLERGISALQSYLPTIAFGPEQLPEYNFANETISCGQARLTGTVDRLNPDPQTHELTVTDYKTGKSFTKWQGASDYDKLKLHKFRQQLMFYKLLVEGSAHFKDYKVPFGEISFVEPDAYGHFYNLSMSYDREELARFQALLEVIWQKIMRLDLPDTSSYQASFNGVLDFEQDLLDGNI